MKVYSKIILALSLTSVLVCGGTISATYAWYQLASEKSVNINGTSINKATNLEVGVVSKVELEDYKYRGLSLDETLSEENKYVYWCGDSLKSDTVSYIMNKNGYSEGDLYPVTSGIFKSNLLDSSLEKEELNLYQAPYYLLTNEVFLNDAPTNYYMHLDLIFKVRVEEGDKVVSKPNSSVFLADFKLSGKAKEAFRTCFETKDTSFILKPASYENGSVEVGGRLDLNADGYFDYMEDIESGDEKEVFYGFINEDKSLVYGNPYEKDEKVITVNDNCFVAPNKKEGVVPLEDVSSYAGKQEYIGLNDLIYKGDTKHNVPLTVTDENGIAYLSMSFFLEGWDKSMINQVLGSQVGSLIQFVVEE